MNKPEYLLRRLGVAAITLLLITFVVFFVIQLPPGDYVDSLVANRAAEGEVVTEQQIIEMKHDYGMDRPFIVRGTSFYYHENVLIKIKETLGVTMVLSLSTMLFTYLVSIPIAIYSAKHQYSVGDYLFTFIGFVGMAVPHFLFALLLMYASLRIWGKPIMGLPEVSITSWKTFMEWVKSFIIPVIVIGTSGTCSLIRTIRGQMLDEMGQPYVLCIRSKGVKESTITYKYLMWAVLNPIVSGLGNMISSIFNGSTITAIVLMMPTLGPILLKALQTQDIYLSGGILLISAFLVVIGNLISDILLSVLDPRIKLEEEDS